MRRIWNILVRSKRHIKNGLVLTFGALGMWLVLWNPVDFFTHGFDHGIWDYSILSNGIVSIAVGLVIVVIVSVYFKVRVL